MSSCPSSSRYSTSFLPSFRGIKTRFYLRPHCQLPVVVSFSTKGGYHTILCQFLGPNQFCVVSSLRGTNYSRCPSLFDVGLFRLCSFFCSVDPKLVMFLVLLRVRVKKEIPVLSSLEVVILSLAVIMILICFRVFFFCLLVKRE